MNKRGNQYAECHKAHSSFGGKADGCLRFKPRQDYNGNYISENCDVCGCHQNYHQKVEPPVVAYRKCQKTFQYGSMCSVDGCQEFTPGPGGEEGMSAALTCTVCGCHRGFHEKVIITGGT